MSRCERIVPHVVNVSQFLIGGGVAGLGQFGCMLSGQTFAPFTQTTACATRHTQINKATTNNITCIRGARIRTIGIGTYCDTNRDEKQKHGHSQTLGAELNVKQKILACCCFVFIHHHQSHALCDVSLLPLLLHRRRLRLSLHDRRRANRAHVFSL